MNYFINSRTNSLWAQAELKSKNYCQQHGSKSVTFGIPKSTES